MSAELDQSQRVPLVRGFKNPSKRFSEMRWPGSISPDMVISDDLYLKDFKVSLPGSSQYRYDQNGIIT